ncbi:hypothetical protein VNI00_008748 [Paramarasmius palmivorus]|uniref:F-box domain-containing protein n=1 Tax=Paramarasmius palmivorus TaxID=297713 RepID=A0AAW0CWQ6_9AGAR
MAKWRSLLAPVHKLPPEILQCIFSFTCDVNWIAPAPEKTLLELKWPAILAISATCGRWREIALSTSSLWSQIGVDIEDVYPFYHDRMVVMKDLLRLFHERSNSFLLSITFRSAGICFEDPFLPVLKVLVEESHRWERLHIRGLYVDDIRCKKFLPIQGNLPNLRELEVLGTRAYDDDEDSLLSLFKDCPKPSSLALRPRLPITAQCPLPWHQLTTLRMVRGSIAEAVSILNVCPNVNSLELISLQDVDLDDEEPEDQVASGVKKLALSEIEAPSCFSCVFEYVTLRQLSELQIVGRNILGAATEWESWDEEVVTGFLNRSVGPAFRQAASLLRLLRRMPHLQTLSIEEYPMERKSANQMITPAFLRTLRVNHEHDGPFLPHLTKLEIVVHPDDLDHRTLTETIMSRWIPDSTYASDIGVDCIKSFSVVLLKKNKGVFNTILATLRWMNDVGAKVMILERDSGKTTGDTKGNEAKKKGAVQAG